MNLKRLRILVVAAIIVAVAVVVTVWEREPVEELPTEGVVEEDLGEGVQSVVLAFADSRAMNIVEEQRDIVVPDDRPGRARRILEELVAGPRHEGAVRTLPENTGVRSVYFDDAGGAYVDFSSELVEEHWGGSTGELFTIRSVVRTLAANFPDVESVTFLVEGEEIETIAGHIDASVPFAVEQYR
ncbi:MAG: hypothetical protein GF405_10240 [Candidatus Eisenbacteria bacterium]|nr:hypothetical protein [Candidatus Eisenbacteria bacterium]